MSPDSASHRGGSAHPRVSVITPSYNQGRYIRATIESVLGQGYPNLEYIVMDGGSKDETVSILREYGDRLRWVSERDRGQTDAINKGLRVATGEIVAYLNSDDVYLPGTIAKVVETFRVNPGVDFVYGDSHAIDADGGILDRVRTIPYDPAILLYDANYICQPASFYRRRLIDRIGLFDDQLHFLMDYEFFLRAAHNGTRFLLIPDYLAAIRFHSQCKSLSDGVHPWAPERAALKRKYAGTRADRPGMMRMLGLYYRAKRYLRLVARGRVDFMNLRLSRKLRALS